MDKLKQIDEFTYKTVSDLLFERVPEYKAIYEDDIYRDEIGINCYLFMNKYSSFLASEMSKNLSSKFVTNSFEYINKLGNSTNMEVINVLRVGILEILYTSGIDRVLISDRLNDTAKQIFQGFSKYYH